MMTTNTIAYKTKTRVGFQGQSIFAKEQSPHTVSIEGINEEQKPKFPIIIIDYEPKIRILFSSALSKEGYETITFGDNAKAIEYLKDSAQPIGLLLLDLDMPHINGRYFCEMVRIKHPRAKIIIASNYALDVQKYLIFNADGYFDKSDGIKALKTKVQQVLTTK